MFRYIWDMDHHNHHHLWSQTPARFAEENFLISGHQKDQWLRLCPGPQMQRMWRKVVWCGFPTVLIFSPIKNYHWSCMFHVAACRLSIVFRKVEKEASDIENERNGSADNLDFKCSKSFCVIVGIAGVPTAQRCTGLIRNVKACQSCRSPLELQVKVLKVCFTASIKNNQCTEWEGSD